MTLQVIGRQIRCRSADAAIARKRKLCSYHGRSSIAGGKLSPDGSAGRSVAGAELAKASKPSKKPRKAASGQKEMRMPITGKKPAKEAIAAVEATAQVGLAIPRGRPCPDHPPRDSMQRSVICFMASSVAWTLHSGGGLKDRAGTRPLASDLASSCRYRTRATRGVWSAFFAQSIASRCVFEAWSTCSA